MNGLDIFEFVSHKLKKHIIILYVIPMLISTDTILSLFYGMVFR